MNVELHNEILAAEGRSPMPTAQQDLPIDDHGDLSVPGLKETLDRIERVLVIRALAQTRGNQTRAARALGITDRIMGLRVKKYGIQPKEYRAGADHPGHWS